MGPLGHSRYLYKTYPYHGSRMGRLYWRMTLENLDKAVSVYSQAQGRVWNMLFITWTTTGNPAQVIPITD